MGTTLHTAVSRTAFNMGPKLVFPGITIYGANQAEQGPLSLGQSMTLSKCLNRLAVASGVSFKETLWTTRQGWGDVEGTLRSSLTPHSTALFPAGSISQELCRPFSLLRCTFSHFGKIKSFTFGKTKMLGLLFPAFFLLTPKPKQEPCLFSVNTHLMSVRKRILFITRIYFYRSCPVSGMQTQTKLVLHLTGREAFALFWETLAGVRGTGGSLFWCWRFFFIIGGRKDEYNNGLFLKQLYNDGYIPFQDMYCISVTRKSTCNAADFQLIFPLCLEIMLACWKTFLVKTREECVSLCSTYEKSIVIRYHL